MENKSIDTKLDVISTLRENAVLVADELKTEYMDLSREFLLDLPNAPLTSGLSDADVLLTDSIDQLTWRDIALMKISSLDGGVGLEILGNKLPFLLKAVTYTVIPGIKGNGREKFVPNNFYVSRLSSTFEYVKGEEADKTRVDVLREVFERRTVIEAMQEDDDISDFLIHGPLVREISHYQGVDLSKEDTRKLVGRQLLQEFNTLCEKNECLVKSCPHHNKNRSTNLMCLAAYLYRKSLKIARERNINLIGVIERSTSRELSERYVIHYLRNHIEKARRILGIQDLKRGDIGLKHAVEFLKKVGYDDKLICGGVLKKGEFTVPLLSEKNKPRFGGRGISSTYRGLDIFLEREASIKYTYIRTSRTNLPFRVEFPAHFSYDRTREILSRIYLYSSLLPRYAFPVNLDIVDKAAKVPSWLSSSFKKWIFRYLQKLLIDEKLSPQDAYVIVANVYEQSRDWLTRPKT